jgi:hypothetical protein
MVMKYLESQDPTLLILHNDHFIVSESTSVFSQRVSQLYCKRVANHIVDYPDALHTISPFLKLSVG